MIICLIPIALFAVSQLTLGQMYEKQGHGDKIELRRDSNRPTVPGQNLGN
jgi:hypothetical protein